MTDEQLEALVIKQAFFKWLAPQLSGWTPALLSYQKGSYARVQLQSEECGTIHCITRKTLSECIDACIKFCVSHPPEEA